jgi:aspartate-semialdehyde dehydrogenase
MNLAIVGATGAVGLEILRVLEKRKFPVTSLRVFASKRSLGKTLLFQGKHIEIETPSPACFRGIDIVFFSAGKKISLEYAPQAVKDGAFVVDNSSAFRSDPSVPLVIPEINPRAFEQHRGIVSCPNCTTAIMLMALGPLHAHVRIKRIVAATYQAASGAGAQAMEELQEETRAYLEKQPFSRKVMPFPYAFNLFTHNSPLLENGYVEEEMKLTHETKKILGDPEIRVTATCVRVPILRAHSIALNVEFSDKISATQAYEILKSSPGIRIYEDRSKNTFPMPLDASGEDLVLCGRIREDQSQPNTLELWVVGDQLLKGAALNAVQLSELFLSSLTTG